MTTDYRVEIPNCEWVSEVIDEVFDGALDSLLPDSVVYGGAVRDVLAGMKIEGDLDIAADRLAHKKLVNVFRSHPKWIDKAFTRSNESSERGQPTIADIIGVTNPYKDKSGKPHAPIERISEFANAGGRTLQIMLAKGDSTQLARNVDIACCGLVLESDGRVFEVVPDAYEHCRRRILRVNKFATLTKFNTLKDRVEKLVSRGWSLDFDLEKEIARLERKLKEIKAKEKVAEKAAAQHKGGLVSTRARPREHMFCVTSAHGKRYISKEEILYRIRGASIMVGDVKMEVSSSGHLLTFPLESLAGGIIVKIRMPQEIVGELAARFDDSKDASRTIAGIIEEVSAYYEEEEQKCKQKAKWRPTDFSSMEL